MWSNDRLIFRDEASGSEHEYRNLDKLAASGSPFGYQYTIVYRAQDQDTGEDVIIKRRSITPNSKFPEQLGVARSIRSELGELFARDELVHILGIMSVQSPYVEEGREILSVQNYIPGETAQLQLITLSSKAILTILEHVGNLITRLIEANIVHGDIKPCNIVVDQDNALQSSIIDPDYLGWGSTSKTRDRPWGTDDYISPEAWQGCNWEPSRDIYSLGIMALMMGKFMCPDKFSYNLLRNLDYQLAFGKYTQSERYSILANALLGNVWAPKIDIPTQKRLLEFMSHALAKPEARPTTAEEIQDILINTGNIDEL